VFRYIHTSPSVLKTFSQIESGKYSVYFQTENLHTYIQVSSVLNKDQTLKRCVTVEVSFHVLLAFELHRREC
jgi:hypothetical protein